jgi:hypothetical protein
VKGSSLSGRRQPSDRFTTSSDQYTLFGRFGDYSPRFTIKNKYSDKRGVYNVDYVGHLEPNNMTRSPRYTIAERRERPLDPDGLVGAQYLPPPFGSFGPRFSIRPKLRDKGTETQSGQTKPAKYVSLSTRPAPDVHDSQGSLPRFSVAGMVAAHESERMMNTRAAVHEPDSDSTPPQSARARALTKRIVQREERAKCGPIGRPDFRRLPDLPRGPMWTISERETADFVR